MTEKKRRPHFAIVLGPPESPEDVERALPGVAAVRSVIAVDRRGCFRYCSQEVLISAAIIAFVPIMAEGATPGQRAEAVAFLREATGVGGDHLGHPIDYAVAADTAVESRHPKTGSIVAFKPAYPVLIENWKPYGDHSTWGNVSLWARGPRVYTRLCKLAGRVAGGAG